MRLGDIAKYVSGITFKPADVVDVGTPGSVVCMRTKNVQELLAVDDLIAVPSTFVKREEQYLRGGDILVSSANSWNLVGKCCFVPELPFDAAIGGFISLVRPQRATVDPRYLYHWLAWDQTQHDVRHLARQTTNIANLPRERFLDLEVPLPPLPEQRRIAAILDEADTLRRKRREALGLLDELLRSAFLEMFGDPVTNPRGWPVVRLGDVCDFVGGGTPSRAVPEFFTGDICWATSKDMGVHDLVDTQEHITDEAISSSATKLVAAGCLLVVVKSKVLAHTLPVAVARVPVCFGQDLKALVPKRDWPAEYLAWHLRIGQTPLLERARGANTEGLTLEHLREYMLLKPPLDLRTRFVVQKEAIAAMQAGAERAAREAEALFASLLHRAFSGEL